MRFNTHDNLTHEAESDIRGFIEREFSGVDQELLSNAAGECAFEKIEVISPRTLVCDECGAECDEDEHSDGDECPTCNKDAPFLCTSCGEDVTGDEYEDGDDCPICTAVNALEKKLRGTLQPQEDGDCWPPMWGTVWKCETEWAERKVRENLSAVKECGFTVYEYEDEVYLGVNGAGYSFFPAHWAPLWRLLSGQELPGDPIDCPVCDGKGKVRGKPCKHCTEGNDTIPGKVPAKSFQVIQEERARLALDAMREIGKVMGGNPNTTRLWNRIRKLARIYKEQNALLDKYPHSR